MEKSLESPGKVPRIVQVMYFKGLPRQFSQQTDMGLPQQWEAQWQEFLKTLQPAHVGWGNPPMADTVPWDDAKGFLAAFEQVAEACRWPREEWVGRLLPALRGGVEQLFCRLDPRDRGDYLKVKAAILRADAIRAEARRKHFRQCCYQELEGPRRAYVTLQELCRQWLKPEKHTKEQILELIIQEQLLALLPPEVQSWVQECGPEDCIETVALAEDFLMSGRRRHAAKAWDWQVPTASSLDAERPQRQHCAGVSRNGDREAGLMASEAAPARNPGLVFPPEGQEAAGVAPPEEPVGVKDALDLSQTPLHWEVMRENSGSSSGSAVGLLIPTPEMDTQPGQQEAVFAPRPEHGEAVPDHFLGGGNLNKIKIEPSQQAVAEAEDTFVASSVELTDDTSLSLETDEVSPGKKLCPGKPQGQQPEKSTRRRRKTVKKKGRNYPPEKKHICSECGHKAYYLSDLLRHMKTHSKKEVFQCPECGKTYKGKSTFETHQRIHQPLGDSRSYKVTRSCSQLKQGFICPTCGLCKSSNHSLAEHMKDHMVEKPYVCPECGRTFRWQSNLSRHQGLHRHAKKVAVHPQRLGAAAEETGKIGDNTLQLKPEGPGVASPTGESSPPRPVSRLRPRSSQGLGVPGIKSLRVVLTKLGSPKKNDHHACPECGFKSDWLSEVIRHTRTHTGERPYTCPDCGKAYRWISNLSRHRKSNICSTNSASPDGSTEESQQADGDTELPEMKDYLQKIIKLEDICVSTTEASSQSISLKQEPCENEPESWGHQGTVQDSSQPPQITTEKEPTDFQKKHACSECGYHAESLSEIVIHTKTHIGEKTFECPDCGKAFRWWSNLLKHRQVHLSYQQAPALETSEVPSPSVAECDVILSDEEELINILAKNPQRGGTKLEGRRGPLSGELSAAASLDFEASVGSATSKGETEGNTRPARFPRNAAAVKANKFNRRERKHECPDCGHRTFYLSDLVRHQRTHTGERPYKCPECKKGFSQKSYLRIHLKVHTTSSGGLINGKKLVRRKKNNQIERKHTCSKCGHKTYKLSTLLMHMKIHTGEKPYKCLECGQTFNWSSNLSRHKRLHQFKRDFNTRKASQQEKWREGLGTCFRNQAHLTLSGYRKEQVSPTPQHSFRSQTIEPGNKTPDVQTEANPPQGKRGDGLPAATNGDASVVAALSERWGYNKQQEGKKDPEGSEGSVQDHDGPVTERKDNLGKKEAEVRARLEKFAYFKGEEVDICQSELSNCQAARAKKKAPYTCSECGKCFRVKRNLADHLNSHTGGKPYQCCECGRCFSWKSKLMRHRIIHTGVKPFHCAECGKDFFRKDSLRVHLKTHGFYPSYGCSECGWSFDQWDQLVRHQRAHTR
ncbi:zinc finger protein 445-like isoform X2 [Varanus komodoensis]|uniref:zinc finger protein 445-like isoform X2 n=1 Tax=Varanus komodoensis TaxID=61221 RepID=UPI001CF79D6F|nr:zinc finger protein 445-like isoform X2 [Varanus komodoensis]